MNFIFIHAHVATIARSMKKNNNLYLIDGYLNVQPNNKLKFPPYGTYLSIFCRKCDKFLFETKNYKEFFFLKGKTLNINNYFDENEKIESVYREDNPKTNLITDKNLLRCKFYQPNSTPFYDSDNIYIGTDEEQKEYFHKKFIEFQQKTIEKEAEIEVMKNKFKDLQKEIKYNSFLFFKDDKEKLSNAYHISIGINSFLSLYNEGWKINYPKGRKIYEILKTKPMIIVGFLGNKNKGKSFLISKLVDLDVPKDYSINTEGINVSFGEKDNQCLAILNSFSQESPLLRTKRILKNNHKNNEFDNIMDNNSKNEIIEDKELNENNSFEENLRDKIMTEKFIENFIIDTSHIVILVVGDITFSEQQFLTRIKRALNNDKYLIVIHNLRNYKSKSNVENYIENTLKKLYCVQIGENVFQNFKGDYHTKYYVEKDSKIIHLILINDNCSIADYYNKPSIDFLKKKLETETNRTKFSVIERIKEFFFTVQEDFLEESIKPEDFIEEKDYIFIKRNKITLKENFFDSNFFNKSYHFPNYYYYTENNNLIINVILPGKNSSIKSKLIPKGEFYTIIFVGKSSLETFDKNRNHLISNNMPDDLSFKFKITISKKDITILTNKDGNLQFYERSSKNEFGIFTFKYNIAENTSDGELE